MPGLKDFCERKTTVYVDWRTTGLLMRGKNLCLRAGGEAEIVIPLDSVRRMVLIGKARLDGQLAYNLLRRGIPVDWLDVFGHPFGQILPFREEKHFLLAHQGEFAASHDAFKLAKNMLLAKTDNCHEIIRRRTAIPAAWKEERQALAGAENPDTLRGHEGACARIYFSLWKGLLHKFDWRGRHARPAPDPVNMLLSTGYSLLHNRLASALGNAGLDPRLGFFHIGRGGHAALASDLMEPLRAIVDTTVLNMIRRQEIAPDNFKIRAGHCVCAEKGAFAKILSSFEDMFEQERNIHICPEAPEKTAFRSVNNLLDDLAASFARHIQQGEPCLIPRL